MLQIEPRHYRVPADPVVEWLISQQENQRLTDDEMADRLGCCRAWWNRVKNRRERLGARLRFLVARRYPETLALFDPALA